MKIAFFPRRDRGQIELSKDWRGVCLKGYTCPQIVFRGGAGCGSVNDMCHTFNFSIMFGVGGVLPIICSQLLSPGTQGAHRRAYI